MLVAIDISGSFIRAVLPWYRHSDLACCKTYCALCLNVTMISAYWKCTVNNQQCLNTSKPHKKSKFRQQNKQVKKYGIAVTSQRYKSLGTLIKRYSYLKFAWSVTNRNHSTKTKVRHSCLFMVITSRWETPLCLSGYLFLQCCWAGTSIIIKRKPLHSLFQLCYQCPLHATASAQGQYSQAIAFRDTLTFFSNFVKVKVS